MGLALSVVLLPAAAKAEISIAVARIAEGYLWVIGQAAESEVEIRLDDRFVERTDRRGNFQFRIVYHPARCIVTLATPAETREAAIDGCGQAGPQGEAGR
jgi:hypothetical protein